MSQQATGTQPPHAWVIGASQGIGQALASILAERGWQLTLSARNQHTLEPIAERCRAQALCLDATDQAAMQQAAAQVFAAQPPELVIMNVGDYQPMPLAAFDSQAFLRLNRANYLASVFLLEAVTPLMQQAGGGQILLNVSAAAYRGLPNGAAYSAPKAATLNMAESLAPELRRQNIRLRVINHGFVRSRLTAKNDFPMPGLMDAHTAAQRIANAIPGQQFEISFPRRLTWSLKLLRCLPYRLYFWLINRWVLT